jgi:hypothetical protein
VEGLWRRGRSTAFEILDSVRQSLNLGVERTKGCCMAPLAQFDWGRPFVKLGEKSGFHLL